MIEHLIHEWADIRPISVKKMNIFGDKFIVPNLKVKRINEQSRGRFKKNIQTFYIKELTDEKEGGLF